MAGKYLGVAGRPKTRALAIAATLIVGASAPEAAGASPNLYFANSGPDALNTYSVPASGAPQVVGGPVAAPTDPNQVRISPDGRFAYVAYGTFGSFTGGIGLYSVSSSDGALSQLVPPLTGPPALALSAFNRDGSRLYTVAGNGSMRAFSIGSDGALTALGSPTNAFPNVQPFDLLVKPDGTWLYAALGGSGGSMVKVPIKADGSLGAAESINAGALPYEGVFDSGGKYLIGADFTSVTSSSSASNGSLGVLDREVSPIEIGQGLAVTADGRYAVETGYAFGAPSAPDVASFRIGSDGSLTLVDSLEIPGARLSGHLGMAPDGSSAYSYDETSRSLVGFSLGTDGSLETRPSSAAIPGPPSSSIIGNRLTIAPEQGPTATFSATATGPLSASFDGSASSDSDGSVARYDWDFGDGTELIGGGAAVSHSYAGPGVYNATLRVTDDEGCSNSVIYNGKTTLCNGGAAAIATQQVTVDSPAPPAVTAVSGARLQASGFRRGKRAVIRLGAGADESVQIRATGTIGLGKRVLPLTEVSTSSSAGRLANLVMKPARRKSARLVGKRFARGGSAKVEITVTFRGDSGSMTALDASLRIG